MAKRSYEQICGVARALDLIGERWTLLVIRELLLGPKRFGALLEALPGISTHLLSARLRTLTEAGIVERFELPAPASVRAYRLSAHGERLREPVEALAIWGFDLLDPEAEYARGRLGRGSWLASTLAAAAARSDQPKPSPRAVNFDVDGDRFNVRLTADRAHVRHGHLPGADGALVCDLPTFAELARGDRRADDPEVAAVFEALAR